MIFQITLTAADDLFWPADMTTITDGGALLLFEEAPRDPGVGPLKRLVAAYAPGEWRSIFRRATVSGV